MTVEYGRQSCDLERLRDSAGETAQFQVVWSCSDKNSNEHTEAAAVDEANVAEVQDDRRSAREDFVDVLPQRRRLGTLDDRALASQNGEVVADRAAAE